MNIDKKISKKEIFRIKFSNYIKALRAYFKLFNCIGGKHLHSGYVGKGVQLLHKSSITVNGKLTLKDFVEINALSENGIIFGANTSIGKYTILRGSGSYQLLGKGFICGNNFVCGDFCFFGCSGGITIGENVMIGQNVRFHAQNHIFNSIDIPMNKQGTTQQGIKLGNDIWVGAGTVFVDGVTVGNGVVIGANTLVNKDIPDYAIVVGNPIRIVKYRK